MDLILCEKPSQAFDIAKALKKTNKKNGYLEVSDQDLNINGYLTWAVGHLVELQEPHEYDARFKEFFEYPIILNKNEFKMKVSENTKKQFNIIHQLFKDNNIDRVIIATDPAREGENIAYKILNEIGVTNEVEIKRLWLSSKTLKATRKAFHNLLPQEKTESLYKEARAREYSDWLVGMNLTRHFTKKAHELGNKDVIHVGRVSSPTLYMVYVRDKNINNFKVETYHKIKGIIRKDNITIETELKNKFNNEEELNRYLVENGITDLEQIGQVKDIDIKTGETLPPKFYDLSALQQDMNSKYKLSAKQTLDIAQNLYEKKLITYPRTDSRYITEDEYSSLKNVINYMEKTFKVELNKEITNKSLINENKVDDHYAILITENDVNDFELNDNEKKVYNSILKNIAMNFMDREKFEKTTVKVNVKKLEFNFTGKVVLERGFKSLIKEQEKDNILPKFDENEEVPITLENVEKQTSPPKRYTENSLLKAMANPMETLEDEGLKSTLKEIKGLGTSATRAGIIENLKNNKYIQIQKNNIYITNKGILACLILEDTLLTKPDLTGKWEQYLSEIGKNNKDDTTFIENIIKMIRHTIQQEVPNQELIKKIALKKAESINIAKCPKCQNGYIVNRKKFYGCTDYDKGCDFTLPKKLLNKTITSKMVKSLCENKITHEIRGFKSKKSGKEFNCKLSLDDSLNIKFKFD